MILWTNDITAPGTSRDDVFMEMAYCIAQLSKDKDTHIGAVIVGPDHEVRSMGYNSFPRGINDYVPERFERPTKYLFLTHAEANAVYNAARIGIPLLGCRLYANCMPCDKCAQAIIQAGIKQVIIDRAWDQKFKELSPGWNEATAAAVEMLNEAKVILTSITLPKHHLPALLRGQLINLDE